MEQQVETVKATLICPGKRQYRIEFIATPRGSRLVTVRRWESSTKGTEETIIRLEAIELYRELVKNGYKPLQGD